MNSLSTGLSNTLCTSTRAPARIASLASQSPGGMDDEWKMLGPGLVRGHPDQRLDPRRIGRLGRHDVPDLDRVGMKGGVGPHRGPHDRIIGHVDHLLLGGRLSQCSIVASSGPRGRDPRRVGIGGGPAPERPGPGIAADVEDRRDAGAVVGAEEALGVGFQAGDRPRRTDRWREGRWHRVGRRTTRSG